MAFSRAHEFDIDIYFISLIGKAISHPARILIIQAIAEHKVASFQEIKEYLYKNYRKERDNSTISNHIKYLKRMNLIKYESKEEQEGYVLNTKLGDVVKYLLNIFDSAKKYKFDGGDSYFIETIEGGLKNNMQGDPMITDLDDI